MTIPGVLLTGGASTRMGRDKARMVVRGEILAAHPARVLSAVCAPVIEVGPGVTGLPSVQEHDRSGPLTAFLVGVDALRATGAVMLLGCDLPFVDEDLVRMIADHPGEGSVVPTVESREQTVCARWSQATIAVARDAHAQGVRSLGVLLDGGDVTRLAVDDRARALADVDSPSDLERFGLS